MILFVSDVHLGQDDFETERAIEEDLLACLASHADRVEHLYLVGDVFDHYIEYRHLVPKGFVRLQALLAEWTDRGIPVTYLVGNHDPWHQDHFERELGVRVELDAHLSRHYGVLVYTRHGDAITDYNRKQRLLKPLLRHPIPVWMYRNLLPGDVGIALARYFSHNISGRSPDPRNHEELRAVAFEILERTGIGIVVMGHTHIANLSRTPHGVYLNPGGWREDRTFGRWNGETLELCRWKGSRSEQIHSLPTPVAIQ